MSGEMTLQQIETELCSLELDPPVMSESPVLFGLKMLRLSRLQFELVRRSVTERLPEDTKTLEK